MLRQPIGFLSMTETRDMRNIRSKAHINDLEYTQSYAEMQFNARRNEHHCATQHVIFDSHANAGSRTKNSMERRW